MTDPQPVERPVDGLDPERWQRGMVRKTGAALMQMAVPLVPTPRYPEEPE